MFTIDKPKQNILVKHGFTVKHISVIGLAVVLAVGLLYIKQPTLFAWAGNVAVVTKSDLPAYYPYAASSQPAVLGASTNSDSSAQVINDDGSIGNASSLGDVLGANTEQVAAASAPVVVKTVPATPQNVAAYITEVTQLEATSIEPGAFETALTSGDVVAVREQVKKVQALEASLRAMTVPDRAADFHKVKITQVHAGVLLLQSMHDENADPEMQSEQISLFLGSDNNQYQSLETLLNYAREGK